MLHYLHPGCNTNRIFATLGNQDFLTASIFSTDFKFTILLLFNPLINQLALVPLLAWKGNDGLDTKLDNRAAFDSNSFCSTAMQHRWVPWDAGPWG